MMKNAVICASVIAVSCSFYSSILAGENDSSASVTQANTTAVPPALNPPGQAVQPVPASDYAIGANSGTGNPQAAGNPENTQQQGGMRGQPGMGPGGNMGGQQQQQGMGPGGNMGGQQGMQGQQQGGMRGQPGMGPGGNMGGQQQQQGMGPGGNMGGQQGMQGQQQGGMRGQPGMGPGGNMGGQQQQQGMGPGGNMVAPNQGTASDSSASGKQRK
ncbi:MAG: hypothetical protein A2X49_11650 [Lentisphaerae bacterium GWF2_52_8]|nr:MAG: hypothetical protein A2X49_11650 [Lentisphaerae bacterium GWF2_52_8]